MKTTVFLVRHGVTSWNAQRRLLGQRDIPLSDEGVAQSEASAAALDGVALTDILSSPLVRAVQTAEVIGKTFGIEVARDPRLADFRVGKWEGMSYDEVDATETYQAFMADPLTTKIPGGESLADVQRRAVGALEQALEDTPAGEGIAVVTHAGIIRVLLAHFTGTDVANFHRFRVSPGSISVLSFADHRELPRLLATNWTGALSEVL